MRISRRFRLNVSQAELDFVDIDTSKDIPLFLDPYLLALSSDPWSIDASTTIRSFFSYFLGLLYGGNTEEARDLFDHLHEPNETCLGLSRKIPQGRGVGEGDAERIFDSLAESEAAKTGLLHDLEDCRVFVNGIGKDKASDMTTNIVRRHLIEYTVNQCKQWDIPLHPGSASGYCWSAETRQWENGFSENLEIANRRILLVPKSVVSYCNQYAPDKYRQHFILKFLQNEHLRLGTSLVQERRTKKSITRFVTKKSIIEAGEAPPDKDFLATFTRAHPHVFKDFRTAERTRENSIPIENLVAQDIQEICAHLDQKLRAIPHGNDSATQYHRVAVSIMDFLFYPRLTKPKVEYQLHNGRKRVDITFDNGATSGFFAALSNQAQIPSRFVFAECKNYGREVGNPEVDQLSGRFSVNSGKFGILLCRQVGDFDLLIKRCRDTLTDGRGLVIPLLDEDLLRGLKERADFCDHPLEDRLRDLHRSIALSGN